MCNIILYFAFLLSLGVFPCCCCTVLFVIIVFVLLIIYIMTSRSEGKTKGNRRPPPPGASFIQEHAFEECKKNDVSYIAPWVSDYSLLVNNYCFNDCDIANCHI